MRYGILIHLPQMSRKEYEDLLKACQRHAVSGTQIKPSPGDNQGIVLASNEHGVLDGVFHRVATCIPEQYQFCTVEHVLNVP